MEEVVELLPGYARYVGQSYGKLSTLLFDKGVILSQTGVQQSDPAGALLFSLLTSSPARNLKSTFMILSSNDVAVKDKVPDFDGNWKFGWSDRICDDLNLNIIKREIMAMKGSMEEQSSALDLARVVAKDIAVLNGRLLTLLGSSLLQETLPGKSSGKEH